MPSDGLSAARLNPDQSNQMPSSGLSASRLNPGSASTSPFDQLDTGFEWKRTFCEQTAYLSITTTDDQVHTYITSVMEVIHRLPKQLKWDSSKPKVQAITSGEESTTTNQKKDKPKGKGKGKGKPKGPPLPDKGKG